MPSMMKKAKDVESYLKLFPSDIRKILVRIRQTIRRAAPEAAEAISYGMPAYRMKRVLVYFAAFKDHMGFFPTSSGVAAFKKELARYSTSKGTVRFKLDEPIPYGLISRIVKFRVKEDKAI